MQEIGPKSPLGVLPQEEFNTGVQAPSLQRSTWGTRLATEQMQALSRVNVVNMQLKCKTPTFFCHSRYY